MKFKLTIIFIILSYLSNASIQKFSKEMLLGKWNMISQYTNDTKSTEKTDSNKSTTYEFVNNTKVLFKFSTDNITHEGTWTYKNDTIYIENSKMSFDLVVKKVKKKTLQLYIIDGGVNYGYEIYIKQIPTK